MTETEPRPERDPDADLTPTQRLTLRVLREFGGELPMRTLVTETGLPHSTVSTATDDLHAKGYVEKRPDATNPSRRIVSVTK